jgi:hypothetical protein
MLNNGDLLTITAGVQQYDGYGNPTNVTPGSWFGMDFDGGAKITGSEKTPIYPGTDGGIVIGTTQSPGKIDYWGFFGNFGNDYTTVAPTGGTTSGIDFSGWTIAWSGTLPINMGSGAWGVGFSNGIANFAWDGVYGNAYTLDYTATVPLGDPSGFGGVKYKLHLEGCVASPEGCTVPIPAAAWLFSSGLIGIMGLVRRKCRVT